MRKLSSATIAALCSGLWVILITFVLSYLGYRAFENLLVEHSELHVNRDLLVLKQVLGSVESVDQIDADVSLHQHFLAENASFAVLDTKGYIRAGTKPPDSLLQMQPGLRKFADGAREFVGASEPLERYNDKLIIAVWQDTANDERELAAFYWLALMGALFTGLLGACGVGLLVSRQFQPIEALNFQIARNSDAFSLRELDVPLNGIEAIRLANSYNDVVVALRNQFKDIERFAEHCAHELRTPLSTLRLSIEGDRVSSRSSSTSANNDRLSQTETQLETIDRLTVLINRLLSLARSRDTGENEVSNINQVVRKAVEEISPLLEESGWQVENDIHPEHWVKCQPAALHQALIDLLDNCIKHNLGGGRIQLKSHQVDRMLLLTVENINSRTAPSANAAINPVVTKDSIQEGFGLGQPIVRRLLRDMGGSVAWLAQPNGMKVMLHLQKA